MAGIKRKSAASNTADFKTKIKKAKVEKPASKGGAKHAVKPVKQSKKAEDTSDELDDSDASEQNNGLDGLSDKEDVEVGSLSEADSSEDAEPMEDVRQNGKTHKYQSEDEAADGTTRHKTDASDSKLAALNGILGRSSSLIQANRVVANNSREAHAKQKALAKERKAAKPNADIIERSKKLWEKLRLKSHVEKDERKKLVAELFEIITDRVKDFVFKHDSVRVIQTAIKYSTMEQRRMIARELKGEFRTLAEGKYSKFLIAKLVEKGCVIGPAWCVVYNC
jgi:pumilio family protein 6